MKSLDRILHGRSVDEPPAGLLPNLKCQITSSVHRRAAADGDPLKLALDLVADGHEVDLRVLRPIVCERAARELEVRFWNRNATRAARTVEPFVQRPKGDDVEAGEIPDTAVAKLSRLGWPFLQRFRMREEGSTSRLHLLRR